MTTASRPAPGASGESGHQANGRLSIARERLLADWASARRRVREYLTALGLAPVERDEIADRAVERAATREDWLETDAAAESLRAARELVPGNRAGAPTRASEGNASPDADASEPSPVSSASESPSYEDPFLAWRLRRVFPVANTPAGDGVDAATRYRSIPPIRRRGMLPAHMERAFMRPKRAREGVPPEELARRDAMFDETRAARERRTRLAWTRASRRRRLILMSLVFVPSIIASGFMLQVLPHHGETPLEHVITILFGALFGWISIGFWTATIGFFLLATRRDRFLVTNDVRPEAPIDPAARTALIMPICEEPVDRVFAGLHAIYRSLERTGQIDRFDLFILSDTADAAAWVREEEAWLRMCRKLNGYGRIFYRRRRVRVKRKSGNVAEFCRAWGQRYRYMVCLDADSVMSGTTIVALVHAMELNPDAGMVQTAPVAFGRRSLYGRVHQFAMRLYGRMFAAGLHFWQLGDGQYWGHNAIIRIAPFMDHCGLGRLPGKPPLGGEILSHDFVEAALMGRAGWSLWLAYNLEGSWEQIPSSLLEEMKRDRRWCQGNLQHLRLVFSKGFFGAHRALFLNGALSYMSALLWFSFLAASTIEAILNVFRPTDYFPAGRSLFPEWPVWRPDWAISLLAVTAAILFLPKLLAVLLLVIRRQTRAFGGLARLLLSVLVEIALSSLFAPIRMVFHARFVAMNLLGRTVSWHSSKRDDNETGWGEALRHHGLDTLIACAWGSALLWLNPRYFFWIAPVIVALVLSIPISVLVSRLRIGDRARRLGLFTIPEETEPAIELRELETDLAEQQRLERHSRDGLTRCANDPLVNALHRALLGSPRKLHPDIRAFRAGVLERVLAGGSHEASAFDKRVLLSDPDLVDEVHRRVWTLTPDRAARWS